MSTEPPVWGTPPAAAPARATTQDVRSPSPNAYQVNWKHTPGGIAPTLMPADAIRRQATVSLVVNLLVLFMAFGVLSAPGAAMALRARSLAHVDPARARRSLTWSWVWLASNVLFYVLLAVMLLFFVISILTG